MHKVVVLGLALRFDDPPLALRAKLFVLELLRDLLPNDGFTFLLELARLSLSCLLQQLFHSEKLTLLLQILLDIFGRPANLLLSLGKLFLFVLPDFLFKFPLDLFLPREHLLLAFDLVCKVLHVDIRHHLLGTLIWPDDQSLRILGNRLVAGGL